jgi:enoyl-CoA hydratase/carnithine racemase
MHVTSDQNGFVRTLTLTRPEKRNALTLGMYARLVELLVECAADRRVRVVLINGAGGAFTAGNDIRDFMSHPQAGEDSPVLRFLHTLVDFDKPLVAAVSGPAIGVGTTMLLHCDLVLASASARFQLPFVNLGLSAEGASSLLLPASSGMARASELLLLGEPFDAARAREAGIVNEVCPDEELTGRAAARAELLAERPPEAVLATKRLLRAPLRAALHEAIDREAAEFRARLVSPEAAEAFAAFFEKRKPDFSKMP